MNPLNSMRNSTRWTLAIALLVYPGTLALAQAPTTAQEAGPGAPPKVVMCMDACEQSQMGCLQGILQIPIERRTIKNINQVHACNRTEEQCDHKCRSK